MEKGCCWKKSIAWRCTLIVVGGQQAVLVEDADPANQVVTLRHSSTEPSPLLSGPGLTLDGPSDAVEILRSDAALVSAVAWGAVLSGQLAGRVVDLPTVGLTSGSNLRFTGSTAAGYLNISAWTHPTAEGSPGLEILSAGTLSQSMSLVTNSVDCAESTGSKPRSKEKGASAPDLADS